MLKSKKLFRSPQETYLLTCASWRKQIYLHRGKTFNYPHSRYMLTKKEIETFERHMKAAEALPI